MYTTFKGSEGFLCRNLVQGYDTGPGSYNNKRSTGINGYIVLLFALVLQLVPIVNSLGVFSVGFLFVRVGFGTVGF